jgi:hypothetical protein
MTPTKNVAAIAARTNAVRRFDAEGAKPKLGRGSVRVT